MTCAHADGTTVTTDPGNSAIIIDGSKSGSSSDSQEPCLEYVLTSRTDGLLPGDSITAIPCRGTGVAQISEALKQRVIRYLPPLRPATAPPQDALVHVHQIFWTTQNATTFSVSVLGQAVTVEAVPQFRWRFGDGQSLSTSKPGRSYPHFDVAHRYQKPCVCRISVTTTWSLRWSDGDEWHSLDPISQRATLRLDVRRAPIRLTE